MTPGVNGGASGGGGGTSGGAGAGTSGGGNGGNGASRTKGGSRFHSPPVELPSSNAQNFFEEAKITQAEENELKRKFGKFCTKVAATDAGGEDEAFLTLDNFCRMLQYYECASAQHYEAYFHAIDRNRDDRLDFQEFFLGCCAADPSTVHILNSFTGYERSQYIFDFYDTNRSATLEFDEFARLIADCLSLQNTDPNNEQVKNTAIEKARDLGALEEPMPGHITFSCIKFRKFYEFIQNERLRGTSRLFRFYKSIIKSRGSHHGRKTQSSISAGTSNTGGTSGGEKSAGGGAGASAAASAAVTPSNTSGGHGGHSHGHSSGGGHGGGDDTATEEEAPSDKEDCEWHAHLLDLDAQFDPDGDESSGLLASPSTDKVAPPPYSVLLPPAPATGARPEPEPPSASDARAIARKVLRTLSSHNFDGLLPGAAEGGEAQTFSLVTAAQLRSLCSAAVRVMEPEDMVLTGIQPPVKVFGALHGQLLDLLSHFKWHQPPVEDVGDILYTTYVFLGDYADRGANGLEVLTILLSLKVAHPHRVALLRGHHESRHVNYHLGLKSECEQRLGPAEGTKIYEHFNRVFEHMSLAAIIGQQILAVGPGTLPPNLTRIEQFKRYKKPLVLSHPTQPRWTQPVDRLNEQVLLELFTPGPLLPREFGPVREATSEQVKLFCQQHRLAAVLRSRQVPSRGYSFDCGGRLITICSCLNYCDSEDGNDASILCITKEEGSQNLQVRPKVLTAEIAKIYQVIGRALKHVPTPLRLHRWPAQAREATPGRTAQSAGSSAGGGDGSGDETEVANDAAGLVIYQDRSVGPASDVTLASFPAYGPGRQPGGIVPRDRDGVNGRSGGGSDSPLSRGRPHGGSGVAAGGTEMSREELALMGSGGGSRAGGPNLNERRSLGSRRSSGNSSKGGSNESGQETKRSGIPAGAAGTKGFVDPIVTSVLRTGEDAEAAAAPPPKGGSETRGSGPSTVGTPTSKTPGGGTGGSSASAAAAEGLPAHRRGGPTTADAGPRTSVVGGCSGTSTGAAEGTAKSPSGGSSGGDCRPSSKSLTAGAATPTGGRSTPASGGFLAGSGERRGGGGGGGTANGGKAAKDAASQALRGPSRPPGAAVPSPKAPASSGGGGGSGPRAQRRGNGDTGGVQARVDCGQAGAAPPSSPRRPPPTSGEDWQASDGGRGGVADDDSVSPTDPQALARLLQDASRLGSAALPTAPTAFLQASRASEQPLVFYLCRLWLEAGLSDKEWTQALQMFEAELNDQPRQTSAGKSGAGTAGPPPRRDAEGCWTLETFSMWLLKRGRRLRECSQWFRAFDFDQDEMISIVDFLQGLVSAMAPHPPGSNTPGGLCTALALFRLLDFEKRQSLDVKDLETILSDAQVSLGSEQQLALTQIAQRATDFEFFRSSLLPRLQGASAFRLRVFGSSSAEQ